MSNVKNWMVRNVWATVFIVCGIYWAMAIVLVVVL